MKTVKNLFTGIFILISIGFLVSSCKDQFTEKDLLELQMQLANKQDSLNAARQLEALNAAGELVSYQVKVVNTDGVGIENLEVSLGSAASDGTLDKQTLTTDTEGQVYFSRVAVGGNNLTITGNNIIDAHLTLDFGPLQEGVHYEIINGNVIPKPVVENSVITVISTNTATATVSGVVTIETDLTNSTPEVPQDVVITADFNDNLVVNSSININYFFATNNVQNIGSATVDNTTGAYSMAVPAGVNFNLTVPDIQANQRIAINGINGQDLPRPEYRDILTSFGPNYFPDNIPTVPGARVVFDEPPPAGRGFTLGNFTQIGRPIPTFTLSGAITLPQEPGVEIITQVTNRGEGYIASPTITITDAAGNGSGAYAEAFIEIAITGLTINNPGAGYAANTSYFFDLMYDEVTQSGTNPDQTAAFAILSIETDGSGVFTQTAVDNALNDAINNGDAGFDPDNLMKIYDNISNLRLVNTLGTTDAVIDVTSAIGRVFQIEVVDGGNDYTKPAFAFSGGGATTQAAMDILEFGTFWSFDVDNSGISVPYTMLPNSISFEYKNVDVGGGSILYSSNGVNQETFASSNLLNLLTVDANGNIQFIDQTASYRTTFYSATQPNVLVEENKSIPAARFIRPYEISTEGQITGLSTAGWMVDFTASNGSGYTSKFNITVEPSADGAPGSGAVIVPTGGSYQSDGEYIWYGAYSILNGGSGYLIDLNVHNGQTINANNRIYFSTSASTYSIMLKSGDTYVVDINYGTGKKSANVY